jgi:hypothetical protein
MGDILDAEGEVLAEELGEAATYMHLDVTDRDQWAAIVHRTVERYGKLNVLEPAEAPMSSRALQHAIRPTESPKPVSRQLSAAVGARSPVHATGQRAATRDPARRDRHLSGNGANLNCRSGRICGDYDVLCGAGSPALLVAGSLRAQRLSHGGTDINLAGSGAGGAPRWLDQRRLVRCS